MKTSQAMTRDVVVVSPSVGVRAARRLMERMNIRHLPVVAEGRLIGMVSDRDLLDYGPDEPGTCGQVMTSPPITCAPDTPVSQLATMMLEHRIDSIPVVQNGRLTGLVTSSDLLQLLVERTPAQSLRFDFRLHISLSEESLEALLRDRSRTRLLA
jgi:acetoin utilization protein AcuB